MISIHTPTRGVTHMDSVGDDCICISIHTPARGVTCGKVFRNDLEI